MTEMIYDFPYTVPLSVGRYISGVSFVRLKNCINGIACRAEYELSVLFHRASEVTTSYTLRLE